MTTLVESSSSLSEGAEDLLEDDAQAQTAVGDDSKPMADLSDILVYDQENQGFKLRQDAFEEVLAEAATAIWSDVRR